MRRPAPWRLADWPWQTLAAMAGEAFIVGPVPTPFHDDETVDPSALAADIEGWCEEPQGLSGFVLGTYGGEEFHLGEPDKVAIIETVVRANGGRRKIIAGIDTLSSTEAVRAPSPGAPPSPALAAPQPSRVVGFTSRAAGCAGAIGEALRRPGGDSSPCPARPYPCADLAYMRRRTWCACGFLRVRPGPAAARARCKGTSRP